MRPAMLAGKSYEASPEALSAQIDAFFTHEDGPGPIGSGGEKGDIKGIVAPHIDILRGGPCFAWAYKALADYLEISRKRLKLANANQVLDITGFLVGTVPPFGHRQRLPTIIEARVMNQDEIYAGGGAINALMRLATDELQRVSAGRIVSLPHPADPA